MYVYERINAYIKQHGLRPANIAQRAGMPGEALHAILEGKLTLYADDLRALCYALEVEPEAFVA